MDKIKEYALYFNWKRLGKVLLVLIPVLIFSAWFFVEKYLHIVTKKLYEVGDEWLEGFLND